MSFDFKNPDYVSVFRERLARMEELDRDPRLVEACRIHYREYKYGAIDLIKDWGVTVDSRNAGRRKNKTNKPALMPFVLFPRQEEWLRWVIDHWHEGENGLSDKSRDVGMSWLAAALAGALGVTQHDFKCGFGSRKEIYVDNAGDPKSLMWKVRAFLMHLPHYFRGGWQPKNKAHSSHMFITIPDTGATITGEAGDNIGRGDRASLYFVDEAAHLQRPHLIEASLQATTDCRIDISSVNGTDNPFAVKRFSWPAEHIFSFHWRDDPRKDDDWYEKQKRILQNPLIIAQEVDLDYSASKTGILIPSNWVQAAIGAAQKLGVNITGKRISGFDVADEGLDALAWAGRHGLELQQLEEWYGEGSDTFKSAVKAFHFCDLHGYGEMRYDADGLGTGVRGDGNKINEERRAAGKHVITVTPHRGSGELVNPKAPIDNEPGSQSMRVNNEDFFKNFKAQSWWHLRRLFQNTYRAVCENLVVDLDEIISIDPKLKHLSKLSTELSQVTYSLDTAGKVIIDKAPDGMRSPNLADSVVIAYAPERVKKTLF